MEELTLIPDDDPRLRQKCTVINPREIKNETLQGMFKVMMDHDGMGLAAPQVGINRRFFIMLHADKPYTCINPRILNRSKETEFKIEGCLSYPGKKVVVERNVWVKVSYLTDRGTRVEKKLVGILARCFQHELDHLNGVVMEDVGVVEEE